MKLKPWCQKPGCVGSEATYMFVLAGPLGYNDGIETLRCTKCMMKHIQARDLLNTELGTLQQI